MWRGIGPSAHLAEYGQVLTERIGKPSRALVHMGTSFADELLTLAPGDAVVLLAYGRVQNHVRVLLERAEEIEIPVVVVTDTLTSALSKAGARHLAIRSRFTRPVRESRHNRARHRGAGTRHRGREPSPGR